MLQPVCATVHCPVASLGGTVSLGSKSSRRLRISIPTKKMPIRLGTDVLGKEQARPTRTRDPAPLASADAEEEPIKPLHCTLRFDSLFAAMNSKVTFFKNQNNSKQKVTPRFLKDYSQIMKQRVHCLNGD